MAFGKIIVLIKTSMHPNFVREQRTMGHSLRCSTDLASHSPLAKLTQIALSLLYQLRAMHQCPPSNLTATTVAYFATMMPSVQCCQCTLTLRTAGPALRHQNQSHPTFNLVIMHKGPSHPTFLVNKVLMTMLQMASKWVRGCTLPLPVQS